MCLYSTSPERHHPLIIHFLKREGLRESVDMVVKECRVVGGIVDANTARERVNIGLYLRWPTSGVLDLMLGHERVREDKSNSPSISRSHANRRATVKT